MNLDSALLEILACPACKSPLAVDDPASELVCTNPECALAYPVRDDIPVLLVDEARDPKAVAGDDAAAAGSDSDEPAGAAEPGGSGSGDATAAGDAAAEGDAGTSAAGDQAGSGDRGGNSDRSTNA